MFKSYLKTPKKKSVVLIKSWYNRAERLPLTFSTGIIADPKEWDSKKQSFKQGAKYPLGITNNGLLNKYKNEAEKYIKERQALELRTPGHKEVKEHLRKLKDQINGITTDEKGRKVDLLSFLADHIKALQDDPRKSSNYVAGFNTLNKNLQKYFKDNPRKGHGFDFVTTANLKHWQNWNFDTNQFTTNTVAGYWKRFKTLLNAAKDAGYITLNDNEKEPWKHRNLALSFQETDEIYNPIDELMIIYSLDLTGHYLETDRDIFLLESFTGYRPSDLKLLDADNIVSIGDINLMKIRTIKTDTQVYTPAGWYLEEFLAKYKDGFPKFKSHQGYARNIKKIGELAGLDQVVKVRKNKGGQNMTVRKKKYELMMPYTCRYNYATNLYLHGVDIYSIRDLMGHTRVNQTESYIKAKRSMAAVKNTANPYFRDKPKSVSVK